MFRHMSDGKFAKFVKLTKMVALVPFYLNSWHWISAGNLIYLDCPIDQNNPQNGSRALIGCDPPGGQFKKKNFQGFRIFIKSKFFERVFP